MQFTFRSAMLLDTNTQNVYLKSMVHASEILQEVRPEDAVPAKHEIKKRLVVRRGKSFIPVLSNDIALCYTVNKITIVQLFNGNKYISDNNLNQLVVMLDPSIFFRVNRSNILNIEAIREYRPIAFSKICIDNIPINQSLTNIVVSLFTSPAFRKWIEG